MHGSVGFTIPKPYRKEQTGFDYNTYSYQEIKVFNTVKLFLYREKTLPTH